MRSSPPESSGSSGIAVASSSRWKRGRDGLSSLPMPRSRTIYTSRCSPYPSKALTMTTTPDRGRGRAASNAMVSCTHVVGICCSDSAPLLAHFMGMNATPRLHLPCWTKQRDSRNCGFSLLHHFQSKQLRCGRQVQVSALCASYASDGDACESSSYEDIWRGTRWRILLIFGVTWTRLCANRSSDVYSTAMGRPDESAFVHCNCREAWLLKGTRIADAGNLLRVQVHRK
mmetsp:Transcript_18784/g.71090  ORF Transcript_18784/g.71090 Transcript_18784/m.71090 type:complete len:229 (-) Transcript_18784:858-1544(-)